MAFDLAFSWAPRVLARRCLRGGALAASAAQPDPSARVAIWNGGDVTVEEFISYYGYTAETERQPLPSLEDELALPRCPDKRRDDDRGGRVLRHHQPADGRRLRPGPPGGMLIEMVQARATEGRIDVPEREVEAIYNKSLTEMEIKQITTRTREEAEALLDSIAAGVAFEDLAGRYSTSPTGENGGSVGKVRWWDFKELWSAHAYNLEPGEVSEVFQVEGVYFILKSYSKEVVPPPDGEAKKDRIRAQSRARPHLQGAGRLSGLAANGLRLLR